MGLFRPSRALDCCRFPKKTQLISEDNKNIPKKAVHFVDKRKSTFLKIGQKLLNFNHFETHKSLRGQDLLNRRQVETSQLFHTKSQSE